MASCSNPARYMIDIAQRVYLEGVGVDPAGIRFVAAGPDGSADAFDRRLGAPPPVEMKNQLPNVDRPPMALSN
jgi:hypothetical protein